MYKVLLLFFVIFCITLFEPCHPALAQEYFSDPQNEETSRSSPITVLSEKLLDLLEGRFGLLLIGFTGLGSIAGLSWRSRKMANNCIIAFLATLVLRSSARDILLAFKGEIHPSIFILFGLFMTGAFIYSFLKFGDKSSPEKSKSSRSSNNTYNWKVDKD